MVPSVRGAVVSTILRSADVFLRDMKWPVMPEYFEPEERAENVELDGLPKLDQQSLLAG